MRTFSYKEFPAYILFSVSDVDKLTSSVRSRVQEERPIDTFPCFIYCCGRSGCYHLMSQETMMNELDASLLNYDASAAMRVSGIAKAFNLMKRRV